MLVISKEYNNNHPRYKPTGRGQGLLLQLKIVKMSGKRQNGDATDDENKNHA
jgi:hypothetical protein